MMTFKCPICGSNSYSQLLSEIFTCDKCSALFSNPLKFSVIGDKNKQDTNKQDTKKKTFNPLGSVGTVISTPIKLNRKL